MAMDISSNYKDYKTDYWEKVQTGQEKAQAAAREQSAESKSEGIPVPRDEYISSEKSGSKPGGLYSLGQDDNGNLKVLYDDPKKAAKAKEIQPKAEPSPKSEDCTTNTDKVDSEIEKLKEKKKQLEQQIKSSGDNEEKIKKLEKKLAQINGEINQKDNDAYRRQNAVIS